MAKLGPLTKTATALDVIFPIVAATLDDACRLFLDEPFNGLGLARSDIAVRLQGRAEGRPWKFPLRSRQDPKPRIDDKGLKGGHAS